MRRTFATIAMYGCVACLLGAVLWFSRGVQRSDDPVSAWLLLASVTFGVMALSAIGVRGARGLVDGPRYVFMPVVIVMMPFIVWQGTTGVHWVRYWSVGAPVALIGVWLSLRAGEAWLDRKESRERSGRGREYP